uniref:Uncharacterized protein n=1 Tax=Panagrolaimus sp. ES5 TaxID=591445 RepID=A0AC34GWG1_9BILA
MCKNVSVISFLTKEYIIMEDVTGPEENRRPFQPEPSVAPGTRLQLDTRAFRPVSGNPADDTANIPSVPVNDDFADVTRLLASPLNGERNNDDGRSFILPKAQQENLSPVPVNNDNVADASFSIASPLNGEKNHVDGRSFIAPKVQQPAPQQCLHKKNSDSAALNEDEEVDAASDSVPIYIPEGEDGRVGASRRRWDDQPRQPQNPDVSGVLQEAPLPPAANEVPAAQEEEPMDWEYAHDEVWIEDLNFAPWENPNNNEAAGNVDIIMANYTFIYGSQQELGLPFYLVGHHFAGRIDVMGFENVVIHVWYTESEMVFESDLFQINPGDQILYYASGLIIFPFLVDRNTVLLEIHDHYLYFSGQFL